MPAFISSYLDRVLRISKFPYTALHAAAYGNRVLSLVALCHLSCREDLM